MIIQQVNISPEITLYITGINLEEKKIKYRLSTMPKILNEEFFQIEGEKVSLPLYFFHIHYINNYLKLTQ